MNGCSSKKRVNPAVIVALSWWVLRRRKEMWPDSKPAESFHCLQWESRPMLMHCYISCSMDRLGQLSTTTVQICSYPTASKLLGRFFRNWSPSVCSGFGDMLNSFSVTSDLEHSEACFHQLQTMLNLFLYIYGTYIFEYVFMLLYVLQTMNQFTFNCCY